jgi:hypothetical protein
MDYAIVSPRDGTTTPVTEAEARAYLRAVHANMSGQPPCLCHWCRKGPLWEEPLWPTQSTGA